MRTRRGALALAMAMAVALLGACGGDDATAEPEPVATEAEETDSGEEPDEALGQGTIVDERAFGEVLDLSDDDKAQLADLAAGQKIGIVAATMATEYHSTLNNDAKAYAESLGFSAEIFDSQEDTERQLRGIEGFVGAGVDAIVVTGLGGETVGPVAQEAVDSGIIVIQVAGRALSETGAITVSVEDDTMGYALGEFAAAWIDENLGDDADGIEIAITDYPEITNLVLRADNIEAGLTENVNTDVEVVGRYLGGTPENGLESMETALLQHPNLQGVLGINDAGNLGAYQAFSNAGRAEDEDAFFFGIDCDPEAVSLIDSGTAYRGCVNTNPHGTAEIAINAYASYLLGREVPNTIEVPVVAYPE